MKKVKNFAAFYALCKRIPGLEESKEDLVQQFTAGRTSSLREMRVGEYKAMIQSINERAGFTASKASAELRAARSKLLHIAQQLGVDTADWEAVDAFFSQSRIAGKLFREMSVEECEAARKRLLAIRAKGSRASKQPAPRPLREKKIMVPTININNLPKC